MSNLGSTVTIDSSEFNQFGEFLREYRTSLDRRELLKIIRKVLKGVVKAAQREVNKIEMNSKNSTGNLWESIGMITGRSKDFVNIQVGPRAKGKFKGFHGAFVEFGTKARKTKGKGSWFRRRGLNRGAATAKPFMKPAFDKSYGSVRANFEAEVAKYVEKRAKQLI